MERKLLIIVIFLFVYHTTFSQNPNYKAKRVIKINKGEKWFGGTVDDGFVMPFADGYKFNLYGDNNDNQAAPLLLSTNGRFIWSDQPFEFSFSNGQLIIDKAIDRVVVVNAGTSLSDAFKLASKKKFAPSGKMPDSLLFSRPQYNTWIELAYNQNQTDILKYAHQVIDNGFPAGVLMIDDHWADYYGKFSFRKDRFPDPASMIDQLHLLGFKVMLWVSPFISSDSEIFQTLNDKKLLLMDNKGDKSLTWNKADQAAIIHWWNGYSALLDFTNPKAVEWYNDQLHNMVTNYKLDGFKFDAGDMEFYSGNIVSYKDASPNEQTSLWGDFGLSYPLNEYRAMWKKGGQPLAERLRDKKHSWEDLQKLIPDITVAGLLGYQFTCPDMIGGGEYGSFIGLAKIDQDLVVRSAQCSALMPMMQFSVAPWRILDSVHLKAVKKAVDIRMTYTPYIMKTVRQSAFSGEPVIRNLAYQFPGQGLDTVRDQFMLGDALMIAPVVNKGNSRKIIFPAGKWKDSNGKVFEGPATKNIEVALDQIPVFEKLP
ncbi:glycoside hydrolase family 31 protein [Mucilaginibacter sp.]|uniref:glycoside hydrolase family 31 protein n=1 Tax=Mucilaginibacter sp. TaxID=1882438 RepID=UPI00283E604A|nr:glycoside hydrolase family 31 protein [Mucilaginibacter sp.]MDR3694479.1 glycoside hydrolase family 31 protein [Mucilaginibacter sp.]